MPNTRSVDTILIKFHTLMFQGEPSPMTLNENGRKFIAQTKSDLLALLLESLPERKECVRRMNTPDYKCSACVYNQALTEVISTLTRLFEEK